MLPGRYCHCLYVCFQDIDYTGLRPVRFQRLGHHITGLCVSGPWLVVTDWDAHNISLYSLPDLHLRQQARLLGCHHPRADSDGVIYVPANYAIVLLEISDSGNMTVIRKITPVGGQRLWSPIVAVAVGPQPGQLCVAARDRLWVVNATDGRMLQELTVPDQCQYHYSVAVLDSGQLLISFRIRSQSTNTVTNTLALYRRVADSPTLLTNLTSTADWVSGISVRGNHFLAPYVFNSNLMVLGDDGSVLHTVDAVRGKLGISLYGIFDVAIWQGCFWVGGRLSDLVLLCAD